MYKTKKFSKSDFLKQTGLITQNTKQIMQKKDREYWKQKTGNRIQNTGNRIQNTGNRIQNSRYRIQDYKV